MRLFVSIPFSNNNNQNPSEWMHLKMCERYIDFKIYK